VLVVGYGGTVEVHGGTPATVSLHRLNQARYRLHEVTRELKEGKGKDERGLATLTTAASSSGEVPHMAAVAEMTNAASPLLNRFREGVEGVEESARVPLTEGIGPRRNVDGARVRGSTRWQWCLGAPPWLREGEREGQRRE
jgi:hypothetical protein